MTFVLDTSFVYALFVAADAHHEKARAMLAEPVPMYLPTEIALETAELFEHRDSRARAVECIESLLALPHVRIAPPVEIAGVVAEWKRSPRLSLADAFVVQTCRAIGATPLTFDKAIAKAI